MYKLIFILGLTACTTSSPKCKCEVGSYIPKSKTCKTRYYIINPCIMIYNPVCGCDGITYNNACEAHKYGVVWYEQGSCKDLKK